MVKPTTALGAFCGPPTSLPPLLSPAFHPFPPLCPLGYSPTSPTALTCTFWPTTSLLSLVHWVEKYHRLIVTQSSNAGCLLDLLLSFSGRQTALRLQPCSARSAGDITFHDFADILIALHSMSPSILSWHVRRCFTVFPLGTAPGPEPRRLNSKVLLGLM